MRYLKYEFPTNKVFDSFSKLLNVKGIDFVEIGEVEIEKAILSEDFETIITPAIMSGKHAVDIIYNEIEPIKEINKFLVYPSNGVHTISGMDKFYLVEYQNYLSTKN